MKNTIAYPTLPLKVLSNQYGFSPCKTYWYIVDANGFTFHQKDKKWRKKELKELTTFMYRSESSANITLDYLTQRFTIS